MTKDDVDRRVRQEAASYNVPVDKMRKELEEQDGLNNLAEQILLGKVIDFLKANVNVEAASKKESPDENS